MRNLPYIEDFNTITLKKFAGLKYNVACDIENT